MGNSAIEETQLGTKEKLNALIRKLTYVLEQYIYLPDQEKILPGKLRELGTYLIDNPKGNEERKNNRGQNLVIAISPKYLENPQRLFQEYKENINEDDNIKLIHAAISYLMMLQRKDNLNEKELLSAYDKVIVVLDCLSQAVRNEEKIIRKNKNWVRNRYSELETELYGTEKITSFVDEDSIKKNFQTDITSLILNDSFKIKNIHPTFNKILLVITEDKNTNEKIKAYIDDAFIFLLLVLFRQITIQKGISFEAWLDTIKTEVIEKLNPNRSGFECTEYKNLKEKDSKSLVGYLWRRDIHFWFTIINLAKNTRKTDSNIAKEVSAAIPDYMTEELRQYRNMAAHSSGNAVSAKWLIRTLMALTSFTNILGQSDKEWNVEATLLEKRCFFEIYNEDRILHEEKPLTKYGNIKYSIKSKTPATKQIEGWKTILDKRKTISFEPDIESTDLIVRAKLLTSCLFNDCPPENEKRKKTAIKQIENFYSDNSVYFPFVISSEFFCNLLETGYPFNPMFFTLTKEVPFTEVIEIARECIETAFSSKEDHPLIMPCDINITYPDLQDIFGPYYTSGDRIRYDFSTESSPDYFEWLEEFYFKKDSKIYKYATMTGNLIPQDIFSSVCKTIVMLSVDKIKEWYGDNPSRAWIRLCCCQPNEPFENIEKTLNILDSNLSHQFSLPQNPFQLIGPTKIRKTMNNLFTYINNETNIYSLNEKELADMEKNASDWFMHLCYKFNEIEIAKEGYSLIYNIIKKKDRLFQEMKLTSDEISFFSDFLKNHQETLHKIVVENPDEEEIKCFSSLYGKCEARFRQNQMILEAQVKQYSKVVWHYYESLEFIHESICY